jgi:integrating conjugative element protein (TIGR03755 family)
MSLAGSQADEDGLLGGSAGDIVQAKAQIDKNAGKSGVQWVQGIHKDGQTYAGGQGQPVIELTADTITAGYNVLIGGNRPYDDKSAPIANSNNAGITDVFASPTAASAWAEYVIGEHAISTYAGGKKKSTPGKGLLHYIQAQTTTLRPIISKLVTGETALTLKSLQELDSPKITISAGVIKAIQKINDPTLQAIWVNRIAQGIAANRVINKANVIRQFLLVGSEVPAIASNTVAQSGIQTDIEHLNLFINSVRQGPGNTQTFLAGSISDLLSAVRSQELANASTQPSAPAAPVLQNGAIRQSEVEG